MLEQSGCPTTEQQATQLNILTPEHHLLKNIKKMEKIIIKFVQSEEHEADIFTKNTTNVIFSNHKKKLVWDKVNVENEMNQELNQSKNQQEGC